LDEISDCALLVWADDCVEIEQVLRHLPQVLLDVEDLDFEVVVHEL
jgi:hypothetical protein